ncbi:MAG: hypothetical protein ACOC8M_01705 [Guyparkeria sp.]
MPSEPDAARLDRRPLLRALLATRPAFPALAAVARPMATATATGEHPLGAAAAMLFGCLAATGPLLA